MRLFSVTALAAIAAASMFAASPVEVTARDAAIDGEFDGMSSFVTTADYKSSTKRQKARLTSPGWLYVETVPADASISIGDAATVGRGTAFHESADAAFVAVKVTAPGYRTFEGYIELKERTVRKVRVELDVMGGSVSVLARPFGSKVTIDGEFVGKTPLTVSGVKAGAREVAVEAKGCKGPLMIMVEVDGMFVLGEDTCAPKMRDVRPTTTPSPKEEREEAAAPAPAPAPEPAPAPVAQPAPAPVAKPAPAPAPAPVAKPEPAPASAPAAQTQGGKKPQCDKICDKFVQAVSPASMQGYIRNSCMTRCESGDLDFSVCAWKAQSMADVQNCNKLPKK